MQYITPTVLRQLDRRRRCVPWGQLHLTEWLVFSLFKDERVSSGRAARLLGITRLEFLDLLRRRGIAYLDYSPDEIAEELEAVQRLPVGAVV